MGVPGLFAYLKKRYPMISELMLGQARLNSLKCDEADTESQQYADNLYIGESGRAMLSLGPTLWYHTE